MTLSAPSPRPGIGGLTRMQAKLLAFIREFIATNGYSPSFDEMTAGLDLKSRSGVFRMVEGLEERGFIRRYADRARGICINETPESEYARGYAQGKRDAIKEFGLHLASAPSPTCANPPCAALGAVVEQLPGSSHSASFFSTETSNVG